MRLIRVCGVEAKPPIRAAIQGDRHPLLWRRVPALQCPAIGGAGLSVQQSTLRPSSAATTAKFRVRVVFPDPPFWGGNQNRFHDIRM